MVVGRDAAEMETKRSRIEKESQFKSLARDLMHELKSLKNLLVGTLVPPVFPA